MADAWHDRNGAWPKSHDTEPIPGAVSGETWRKFDSCAPRRPRWPTGRLFSRSSPRRAGRSANKGDLARLSETQLLAWADAFHARQGRWPAATPDRIPEAPAETWAAIDSALRSGCRGLPGGSSLLRFLAARRGAKNVGIRHRPLSIPRPVSPLAHQPFVHGSLARDHLRPHRRHRERDMEEGPRRPRQWIPGTTRRIVTGPPARPKTSRCRQRDESSAFPYPRAPSLGRLAPCSPRHVAEIQLRFNSRSSGGDVDQGPNRAVSGRRGLPGGSSLARLLAASRGARNIRDLSQLRIPEIEPRLTDVRHDNPVAPEVDRIVKRLVDG